jgi:hypothetical protein
VLLMALRRSDKFEPATGQAGEEITEQTHIKVDVHLLFFAHLRILRPYFVPANLATVHQIDPVLTAADCGPKLLRTVLPPLAKTHRLSLRPPMPESQGLLPGLGGKGGTLEREEDCGFGDDHGWALPGSMMVMIKNPRRGHP